MKKMINRSLWMVLLLALIAPVASAQTSTSTAGGVGFGIGVRYGMYDVSDLSQTFDLLYNGDSVDMLGIDFDVVIRNNIIISLGYQSGDVSGFRAFPTTPPVVTTIPDELSLTPLTLTVGYLFRSTKKFQAHIGVGATFMDWKNTSLGTSVSDSETGWHGEVGVRYAFNKLSIGVDARLTDVDGEFKEGIAGFYGESGLGGESYYLVLRYRFK